MTIKKIWDAGNVNRWHTNPNHALRNSQDTNHGHSARVALLMWSLWPETPKDALLAALVHDLPEVVTGDMSGEAKRSNPEWASALDIFSNTWLDNNGMTFPHSHARLKLCDHLDAALWARQIDPTLMDQDDWKAQIKRIVFDAHALGVGAKVEEVLL